MRLLKTLRNGNQVFEAIEATDRGPRILLVERDVAGQDVKQWRPSFDEIAGHSSTAKEFGR